MMTLGRLVVTCVLGVIFLSSGATSLVYGQYSSPPPGTTGTPFPSLPPCSSGTCGTVCTSGLCPPPATCSPFCNNGMNPPSCGFTCSTFQGTCTTGWGEWGECVGGVQIRVCNNNPQLGQQQWCSEPGNTGGGGGGPTPTGGEPTVPPATPSNTPPPGATLTPTPPIPTNTSVPVGTIRARAVEVTTDTSCTAIRAVSTGDSQINGTTHEFTPSSASNPPAQTQSNADYVTFSNAVTGSYSLVSTLPSGDWVIARSCWSSSGGSDGEGASYTLSNGETLTWDVGYTLGTAWVQTENGNVYASGTLRSYIPASTAERLFTLDGTGSAGVITFGTSYDFDANSGSWGEDYISTDRWNVNATRTTVDYYDFFYRRFGAPANNDNGLFSDLNAVSKPASRETPYYINGDMATSGNWNVTDGETVIFIVDGDLTINGDITIDDNTSGFAAFIVNGDIQVASSVGTTFSDTTSVLDGIYVTSPAGTFSTGTSTSAGNARLVAKGMFVAGDFLLERDLQNVSANTTHAAELFIYDPRLLLTMPETMKELPVLWQEVAP